MKTELYLKIINDQKIKEYLKNNSYWYKYLNRSDKYYEEFLSAYKNNKKIERINKANSALDTIDTVSSIINVLK